MGFLVRELSNNSKSFTFCRNGGSEGMETSEEEEEEESSDSGEEEDEWEWEETYTYTEWFPPDFWKVKLMMIFTG